MLGAVCLAQPVQAVLNPGDFAAGLVHGFPYIQ